MSRPTPWSLDDVPDQTGRIAIVTGANTDGTGGMAYTDARRAAILDAAAGGLMPVPTLIQNREPSKWICEMVSSPSSASRLTIATLDECLATTIYGALEVCPSSVE
jgi:hypothetical protein